MLALSTAKDRRSVSLLRVATTGLDPSHVSTISALRMCWRVWRLAVESSQRQAIVEEMRRVYVESLDRHALQFKRRIAELESEVAGFKRRREDSYCTKKWSAHLKARCDALN